jgi:hypothetical protein
MVRLSRDFASIELWQCLLVLTFCVSSLANAQAQSHPDEYRIKAAFLFHFAQLIDWPSEAFTPSNSPLVLCTVGDDSFQGELENSVEGKTVGSRVLRVRHLRRSEGMQGCHIIFIGEKEKSLQGLLTSIGGISLLTVGEAGNFVDQGGIIGFCMEGNKIRFEVNLEAAQRARLRISSRLLMLAKRVVGNSGR